MARNRTPEAFELPASAPQYPDDVFLLHEVVYTENNRFQHPLEKQVQRKRADPCWYNCLRFSPSENALSMTLEWERCEVVPRRPTLPRTAWSLQKDQWGRIIYNLRNAGEDHWIYKKICHLHWLSPFLLSQDISGNCASTYVQRYGPIMVGREERIREHAEHADAAVQILHGQTSYA